MPASEFTFGSGAHAGLATFTAAIPALLARELQIFMQERNVTVSDVVRIALRTINRHPLAYDVSTPIKFGKYAGEILDTVIRVDPAYVDWAVQNVEQFKLTDTAAKLLNRLKGSEATPSDSESGLDADYDETPFSDPEPATPLKGRKRSAAAIAKQKATCAAKRDRRSPAKASAVKARAASWEETYRTNRGDAAPG